MKRASGSHVRTTCVFADNLQASYSLPQGRLHDVGLLHECFHLATPPRPELSSRSVQLLCQGATQDRPQRKTHKVDLEPIQAIVQIHGQPLGGVRRRDEPQRRQDVPAVLALSTCKTASSASSTSVTLVWILQRLTTKSSMGFNLVLAEVTSS
eukprot:366126-Chlamydomonas_euryale.AAC.9